MHLNKILRLCFIAAAAVFLFVMLTTPKTHCQVCEIQSDDGLINGYEAFNIFEETCISYKKPWSYQEPPNFSFNPDLNITDSQVGNYEPVYVDIDKINTTYDKDGKPIYSWNPEDEMTREEVDNLTA